MSSRGRGYGGYNSRGSRGGFRGSYRGNSRGSYESRGGRGGGGRYFNDSPRYSGGGDGGSRYRDRQEDSYKKPYRPESNSYSSRDYAGRSGSPERKRMRIEGSSDRRSHDGGGHYYGSRQDSYSGERRAYNGEGRRSSPSREAYRKPSEIGSGARSPPRSAPLRSRVLRAPRRSMRGRTMRSRGGYFRGSVRSRPVFAARRYTDRAAPYTRVYRSLKGRRPSTRLKEDEPSSTEEDWDAEDKEDEVEEKKEVKAKSPKIQETNAEEGEEESAEVGVGEEGEGDAGAEDAEETEKEGGDAASEEAAATDATSYITLKCVHCKEKYANFREYTRHLSSGAHREAMSNVARRHKAALLRMRVAQREAQRVLETAAGAQLAPRTAFCPVCRLNHRTTRHSHNLSDTHRAMKRFLTPFCRFCRLSFRSPMIYEHHIASIEHLKRKSRHIVHVASPKVEGDGTGDEGMDVDLDNFMTLDSVGDVDEVDDEDSGTEKKNEDGPKKPKVEINIGSEHIKKIEVLWCELCRVNLPRDGPGAGATSSEALRRHCRLSTHLRRYVQHRDTRTLRKHAERIHRQLHQNKEGDKEIKEEPGDADESNKTEKSGEVDVKKNVNGTDNPASGNDDKLWADVDKDIGDLLREVDPQVNEAGSDDDDDLDRYDKFRKSDKEAEAEEVPAVTADKAEKSATELNVSA